MAQPSCPDSRAAAFSRCGRYRWWLSRRWRDNAPTLLFLGLNPSRADHQRDDPTLRRLIGFADSWGYGAIEVVNLFAWISADPAALRQAAEPVGRRTDLWIRQRIRRLLQPDATLPLWLGWGNGGSLQGRDQQMLRMLSRLPVRLLCLETTASGQPRHPLYAPGGGALRVFAPSWGRACASPAAPCPAPRAATRST